MTASVRTTAEPSLPTVPRPIAVEVLNRLRRSGYLALQDVSCVVNGEHASLQGRLPSYYLKQVAQSIVAEVDGIRRVTNLIEVVNRPAAGR